MTTFTDLGVPSVLATSLAREGKLEAFPIQRDTLPDSLAGRDILGRGRTGSGKTIAFAIPLVASLAAARKSSKAGQPRGLVLVPTRELATQVAATVRPLAEAAGLRVATIFGGVGQRPQQKALQEGVEIIVACPGRLEDLIKQGIASLRSVETTVIDEADHMADLGFLPAVTRLLSATPQDGQRLLFSATLDRGVDVLANRFLHNPVSHSVDDTGVPVGQLTHRVLLTPDGDPKRDLVQHLAQGMGRRILFTRTKHQAKKLAKKLTESGIPAVDLHGNLSQTARERNLAAFSADPADGGVRVLVATDVAARGVHVDNVDLVVHVDPPMEHKAYVHRSGRTARAGAEGTVVTVVTPAQRRDVEQLLRRAQISADIEQTTSGIVTELVGATAPHVKPQPVAARPARAGGGAPRPNGGSGRGRNARGQGRGPAGQGRGQSGQSRGQSGQGRGQGQGAPARSQRRG